MATADNGNFDLVIELPDATLSAQAIAQFAGLLALGPMSVFLQQPGVFTGSLQITPTITTGTTASPLSLFLKFSLTGSTGTLQTVTLNNQTSNVPNWMQAITLDGTIDVQDSLAMNAAFSLSVNFAAGQNSEPIVDVTIDPGDLFDNPAMVMALAQAILNVDPAAQQAVHNATRRQILDQITNSVQVQFRTLLRGRGTVALASPPPTFPLPTGAVLAPVAGAFRVGVGPGSIHLAYDYTGAGGNLGAVTSSMLLRDTATGLPLDALGVSLRNSLILGGIIRAIMSGPPLGLPASGFIPGHPCFWLGPLVIPPPAGTPAALSALVSSFRVTKLMAGIGISLLHIVTTFTAHGIFDAFTAHATIDQTFSITAIVGAGNTLVLALTPTGPPVVESDADIAWWVYAGATAIGAATGGAGLAAAITLDSVLLAVDLFGGSFANGPLAGLIAPLMPGVAPLTVPLAATLPPLTVRSTTIQSVGATRRLVTVPVPGLGPVTIPDSWLNRDVLITFV
jgi:hypothetical protein